MSQQPQEAVRPSKIAIVRMLAELDSKGRRATRYGLLLMLAPILLGGGLLAYTFMEVRQQLKERDRIRGEIAELKSLKEKLTSENAELTTKNVGLALTASKVENIVQEGVKTGEGLKSIENKILNTIKSNPTVAETTPRVFVHIQAEEQRDKARQVAQALKGSGYVVPGIERRPERVDGNQVKYFRQEDKAVAEKVAGVFAGQGVRDAKLVFVRGYAAPPGQIEIWFEPAPVKPRPTPTPTPGPSPPPDSRASRARLVRLLYARLDSDAKEQLGRADETWQSLQLGHFYSSEVSVDIAVKSVMLRTLSMDDAYLPDALWVSLRDTINRTTTAQDAITIMAQTSSGATRH